MRALSISSVGAECPHIVRYFNSWIEKDRVHIVMELCVESLKDVIKRARGKLLEGKQATPGIPEAEIRKFMRDILLGL